MRPGLGYISTVLAPATTTGPLAPVVIGIFAVASFVLPKLLHWGAGRTEADFFTDPNGPQTIAGRDLDEIIGEYSTVYNAGEATPEFVRDTVRALEKVRDDFCNFAASYPRAGPGACKTIADLVYRLVSDRRAELQILGAMNMDYPVYRLMLKEPDGSVSTGATYPGCSSTAPDRYAPASVCDPRVFSCVADAFSYAQAHGEIPYVVQAESEAWNIADAEERARQLQQQYTGPSASPLPADANDGCGATSWEIAGLSGASLLAAIAIGWIVLKKVL